MNIVVFAGPSLPGAKVQDRLGAAAQPPAAVGDVLRAVRGGARVIAVVDGVFERVLPVWHKEILWALFQGVHVWGGASMGALRAAELAPFGMVGVGRVFEAFRDGALDADDEVAVLHGPAETGFAAVTEALVNVRATLARAVDDDVLARAQAEAAIVAAQSLGWRDRTWEALLPRLEPQVAARLRTWLPAGRIDLKRADALELLDRVAAFAASDPQPFRPDFAFAWTDAWDAFYHGTGGSVRDEAVLDELRLRPDLLPAVRRMALLRLLVRREAARSAADTGPVAVDTAAEALRSRHGLWSAVELRRWLAESGLDRTAFDALARDEAAVLSLERNSGGDLDAALLAEMQVAGLYPEFATRARAKAQALEAAGVAGAAKEAGIDPAPVLAKLAAGLDGAQGWSSSLLAGALGFGSPEALERAALREALFVRMMIDKENAE